MVQGLGIYFTQTPTLSRLIEDIALMQGEIKSASFLPASNGDLLALARVDAVHFSTKIEGNKLTLPQVTQALSGNSKKNKPTRDLREVLNYSKARSELIEAALRRQELTLPLILKSHEALMTHIVTGKLKGHFREAQNVIRDSQTRALVYVPPTAEDVPQLMKDLVNWCRAQKLEGTSALICAAIFHWIFVTIHPFMDGNGRLARLLSNFILFTQGYDVHRFAAIEKQHELNRSLYYQQLRNLQQHNFYDIPQKVDVSSWIEYWLTCLKETYREALSRIAGNSHSQNLIINTSDRISKALALFGRHKKMRASDYQSLTGLGRTQAIADLNELVKKKLIKRCGGGRSTVYELVKFKVTG